MKLGEIVYLKTDTDQLPRMVIYKKQYLDGSVYYGVIQETIVSEHFPHELSDSKMYF